MNLFREPRRARLRIISAICCDFFVAWVVFAFSAPDVTILTSDILAAILSLVIAVKAEEKLESYDGN